MSAPTIGHRAISVLAGVLLAGTALAAPAVATGHSSDPGPESSTTQAGPAVAIVHKGRVIARPAVNVRPTPDTSRPPIGSIPYGTVIDLECKKSHGEVVGGNPRWYKLLGRPGWVAARWVENVTPAPPECP
ncbi:SH3 domain-containing protein [Streptomyces sp. SID3212]|uniref:SH3 domain-containing protein n=1 Tax=Streptomyces sp. SID3212 TaxID=2690259 RepID=UPI00136CC6CD|nr:SH3 domain-containing protein [Streptomyces sp. SID3212]MYV52891.1 SH3 domain-containing protein [Streptomyces sp. SID3212]